MTSNKKKKKDQEIKSKLTGNLKVSITNSIHSIPYGNLIFSPQ